MDGVEYDIEAALQLSLAAAEEEEAERRREAAMMDHALSLSRASTDPLAALSLDSSRQTGVA